MPAKLRFDDALLDQLAVAAISTGALAFFFVRFLRKRAGGKSCAGGCGCGTPKPAKPRRP